MRGCRSERRLYDIVSDDRRQRWRQPHYRSVLRAEGFVLRTVRARRQPGNAGMAADARDHFDMVAAALAGDVMRLAGELRTVVLLTGGEQAAGAAGQLASRALRSC